MQLDGVNDQIQGNIEIVLEHLEVHDKYFPQLGKVINHWKNCLLKMKKKHVNRKNGTGTKKLDLGFFENCLCWGSAFCPDGLASVSSRTIL